MRLERRATLGIHEPLLLMLTSAVGVLVLPLALMQMRAYEAVARPHRAGQAGSVDDFAGKKKLFDEKKNELARKQQAVQAAEGTVPESRRKLEAIGKEISALQTCASRKVAAEDDGNDLKKLAETVAAQQKRAEELKLALGTAESRLAELQAQFDATPLPAEAPPPKEIHPPNPRPAPQNWEVVEFVCRNRRVAPLNEDGLRKNAQARINRAESTLSRPDGIDCEALVALFEKEEVGTQYFKLKIVLEANKPKLLIEHRPETGETPEEFKQPTSLFQRYLRQLEAPKHWVRFRVYPDSFETYLEARNVVGKHNIPAGWQATLEKPPYVVDLGLAGNLACSGQKAKAPLTPEQDKINRDNSKELRGRRLLKGVQKTVTKNDAAKKAPLTFEKPQTSLRPSVPNDDID